MALRDLTQLIIGIGGLIVADRTPHWRTVMLLTASIVLTTFVFFGSSRFRFPLMPFLVLYGSLAWCDPRSTWQQISPRKKILLGCTVIVVSAVWITEAILVANV
jgi:hypothetical protein